jgi:hypothetical protein
LNLALPPLTALFGSADNRGDSKMRVAGSPKNFEDQPRSARFSVAAHHNKIMRQVLDVY